MLRKSEMSVISSFSNTVLYARQQLAHWLQSYPSNNSLCKDKNCWSNSSSSAWFFKKLLNLRFSRSFFLAALYTSSAPILFFPLLSFLPRFHQWPQVAFTGVCRVPTAPPGLNCPTRPSQGRQRFDTGMTQFLSLPTSPRKLK